MGWAVGYDPTWKRDIGYGVPAVCDHPECTTRIDRGLAHVCANGQPYGGDGCGLYFCEAHLQFTDHMNGRCCARCADGVVPFDPTPDVPEWVNHKLTDPSWALWREQHGLTTNT